MPKGPSSIFSDINYYIIHFVDFRMLLEMLDDLYNAENVLKPQSKVVQNKKWVV